MLRPTVRLRPPTLQTVVARATAEFSIEDIDALKPTTHSVRSQGTRFNSLSMIVGKAVTDICRLVSAQTEAGVILVASAGQGRAALLTCSGDLDTLHGSSRGAIAEGA